MREDLISYETAILAKECDFNWEVCNYFKLKTLSEEVESEELENLQNINQEFPNQSIFSRPSQSQLQKWLRKKYDINTYVVPNFYNRSKKLGYLYQIDVFVNNVHDGKSYDDDQMYKLGEETSFKTYELALEKGLLESLKIIEKKK